MRQVLRKEATTIPSQTLLELLDRYEEDLKEDQEEIQKRFKDLNLDFNDAAKLAEALTNHLRPSPAYVSALFLHLFGEKNIDTPADADLHTHTHTTHVTHHTYTQTHHTHTHKGHTQSPNASPLTMLVIRCRGGRFYATSLRCPGTPTRACARGCCWSAS